jgi:hypothetical protein
LIQRGVAFFSKGRGAAQRIDGSKKELSATGLGPPLAVIAASIAVIAAIALFDERFNAFTR